MATNVSYKNNSLTSFNSGTKILKTAGKYMEDDVTITTSAGSAATPATTITANPAISVNASGLITATASASQSITPTVTAGYVGTGTAGTITVSGSNTNQLSTAAGATITPTKAEQTAVAAGKYTTGAIKVAAIPANYITTTDADATAANILLNKTAYVDGSKITGEMPNNGATGGTITSQGGTYTIPAGYTSGGTVTANLTASGLTNTIINGAAALEDTNDYAFEVEVNIPAGYHNAQTLTKSFSSMLPAPTTEGAAAQVLAGYDLYNHNGQVVSGSMTNNSAWNRTLDDSTTSVTIPAGYHNGNGAVSHTTVAVPNPTITVSSSGLITASGSWTKGYTTNNSYSQTQQLTTKAAATITPGTANQTIASGTYLTGTQTIAGDADLVASNIISTANIFGVQGSVVIQNYYTGTTEPSSSLGNNGDLYLQTNE